MCAELWQLKEDFFTADFFYVDIMTYDNKTTLSKEKKMSERK